MPRKGAYKIVRLWGGVLEKSVAEHHIDGFKLTSKGHVSLVHHIYFGWIKAKDYYDLQKAHEALPLVQEFMKGGYLLNAAVYAFNPQVEVAGFGLTVPIGGALLGSAVFDLVAALAQRPVDAMRTLKAAYKTLGPFGALIQIVESATGVATATAQAASQVVDTFNPTGGEDPCSPTLFRLFIEFFNAEMKELRERECAERQGTTSPMAPTEAGRFLVP